MEKPDSSSAVAQLFADLQLTEEEQKLLRQEGVSLPTNLPLTKVSFLFQWVSLSPDGQNQPSLTRVFAG